MRLKSLDSGFHLIAIVLIVTAGSCVYANSTGGGFIWDDEWLVKDNEYIRAPLRLVDIFSASNWTGTQRRYHFWRPLQILSYTLDYSLWGLNTRGYHLTNIGLHILVSLCPYSFVFLLFKERVLSLLTAILFTVHPVHTEAVSYISGRADPLVLLFLLLTLILYIRSVESSNNLFYLLMLLGYAGALLARENNLIFPALLLLYHYIFKKNIRVREFVSVLVITAAFIAFRLTVLRQLLPDYSGSSATLVQRIPGFFAAITDYIRLLIAPFTLHMAYGNRLFAFLEPKAILGIIITAALLFLAFRVRKKDIIASFGILWFFIALLPMSNLYPIGSFMAEHWLYMPSIGFFLVVSDGLYRIYRQKNLKALAVISIVLLFISYSYLTIRQNAYWQSPLTFYQRTIEHVADNSQLHYNLGNIYRSQARPKEAVASYRRAIELNPHYAESYNNLGITLSEMGRTREAMACYKKAIDANPGFSYPYCNLARAYDSLGDKDKALDFYKKAVALDPGNGPAHYNMSILYFNRGDYDAAARHCGRAAELGYRPEAAYLKILEEHRGREEP